MADLAEFWAEFVIALLSALAGMGAGRSIERRNGRRKRKADK